MLLLYVMFGSMFLVIFITFLWIAVTMLIDKDYDEAMCMLFGAIATCFFAAIPFSIIV